MEDGLESWCWGSLADYARPPTKRRGWVAVEAGLLHLGYEDNAAGRRKFLETVEGLVSRSPLKRAGIVEMEGAGLNATLRRGWCYGSSRFREKVDAMLGKQQAAGKQYRVENGYDGLQLRSHSETAARQYIQAGLKLLGLSGDDLPGMRKMDVRKALLARLVRRKTQVGLEWIAMELKMGVRSSVSRAERNLSQKMKHDKQLREQWEKLSMQQISS